MWDMSCMEAQGMNSRPVKTNSLCEYSRADLPCDICVRKGLICGKKSSSKDWERVGILHVGRRKRQFSATIAAASVLHPEDSMPGQFEEVHLRSVRDGKILFGFASFQLSRVDGGRLSHIVLRRFGGSISSKPVRYGCILYSMYKNLTLVADETSRLTYLTEFYKSTRAAIDREAYADLVYGCFAGCMYLLRIGKQFEEIIHHVRSFQTCVTRLLEISVLDNEEMLLLECMWEKLLWYTAKQFLVDSTSPTVGNQLVSMSKPLLPLPFGDQPTWIHEAYSEIRIKLQFVRLIALADTSKDLNVGGRLKESLTKRFFNTHIANKKSPIYLIPADSRVNSVSRPLWSAFFTFLTELKAGSEPFRPGTIESIIVSVHTTIELILNMETTESTSDEYRESIDLAIYSLVLVGLTTVELLHDSKRITLRNVSSNE